MLLSKTYLDIIRETSLKNIREINKKIKNYYNEKMPESPEDRTYYNELLLSLNASLREVDNIYYLFLLEDKSVEYNKEEVFLNTFVTNFINGIDYIDKNDVYFEKIIDENYIIKTDSKKLKVVLENIILRIFRTLKTGKIIVRVREAQNDLIMEIIDTSRGLSDKQAKEFKNAPDADRRHFDNLDLYVAYKLMEEMNNTFDIEKTQDFIRYVITFSKVKNAEGKVSKKILIIDDDIEFIRLIQLFQSKFAKSGYEVEYETTAKDGLDRIKESMPDVILLDLMLPDMTGLYVCEEIRKLNKSVPVVILTAYGSDLDEKKAYELGANYFLNKSYDFKALLEQIQRFI